MRHTSHSLSRRLFLRHNLSAPSRYRWCTGHHPQSCFLNHTLKTEQAVGIYTWDGLDLPRSYWFHVLQEHQILSLSLTSQPQVYGVPSAFLVFLLVAALSYSAFQLLSLPPYASWLPLSLPPYASWLPLSQPFLCLVASSFSSFLRLRSACFLSFVFLSPSFSHSVYSFAVNSLAPVMRLVRFFETAASSDGVTRMSARSSGTNPAARRGFTIGEKDTGVEKQLQIVQVCL